MKRTVRLQIPTPFPVGPINVYLLKSDPITIIDTGPNTAPAKNALTRALAAEGFGITDIKRVLVTHGHSDHSGLTGWLEEHGAQICIHPAEAKKLSGINYVNVREAFLAQMGTPPEKIASFLDSANKNVNGLISTYNPLQEGVSVDFHDFSITVVETPGHCRGHLSFYQKEAERLQRRTARQKGKRTIQKLDEKIMLSLKIKRLQIAVLFIIAIFATTSINGYFNKRSHLRSDLAHVEQSLWTVHLGIENVKTDAFTLWPAGMFIENINDRNNIIFRNLNNTKKRLLRENNRELFLHPRLTSLLNTLNQRYLAQTWSERDEAALTQLNDSFTKAVELLTEERLTFNNLRNNKLSFTYTNDNKLPQEISPLTNEELEARLHSLSRMQKT